MSTAKRILLAVNDSEISMRAVRYVGEMCGGLAEIEIWLLHVVPEPSPHYHSEDHNLTDYTKEKEAQASKVFAKAAELLNGYGITLEKIKTRSYFTERSETISGAILKFQEEVTAGTVVVGKRGVSKAEEFLFGSISNAIAQKCNSFAVWIVA
jgi:nucleotide-binding universal stress UspA family protein